MWLLALPLLLYTAAFFVLPLASVVRTSLTPGYGLSGGGWTAAHYSAFFTDAFATKALINTLVIAVVTVVCTAAVGLVYAYLLSVKPGLRRLQLALLLAPLLVNGVVRIFGLQLGLDALNQWLQSIGIIHAPLPLQYSMPAVVIGLVMFLFPYMAMSIYASLARLDVSLVEAARTLGANRWSTMRRVVLPMAMPGVMAGSVLTFAAAAGSYIVPAMMGGGRVSTVPVTVYNSVSQTGQWGDGSAYAIILAAILLIPILRFSGRGAQGTAGSR